MLHSEEVPRTKLRRACATGGGRNRDDTAPEERTPSGQPEFEGGNSTQRRRGVGVCRISRSQEPSPHV